MTIYLVVFNMKKIALLFGGRTDEHEVSVNSARYLGHLFQKLNYPVTYYYFDKDNIPYKIKFEEILSTIDTTYIKSIALNDFIKELETGVAFPLGFGRFAEDGKLYALLEMYQVPTLGGPYNSYVISFDKLFTKYFLCARNYPTLNYKHYSFAQLTRSQIINQIKKDFTPPIILKPRFNGSSIGISVVRTFKNNSLEESVDIIKTVDDDMLCEPFITPHREFQIGIIKQKDQVHFSEIGELVYDSEFLDIEEKFSVNSTCKYQVPQSLSLSIINQVHSITKNIIQELQLNTYLRMDYLYNQNNDVLYVNEISPMFGLTEKSGFWQLWQLQKQSDLETLQMIIDSKRI
jgi:D-alanine-D-alanine ligase